MLSPEETQRLQSKLAPNEQILWTGKPIPSAFSDITIEAMAFGFLWWGFLCFFICTFFSDYDPNANVYIFGVKKTASGLSAGEIALFFAFLTPFIAIGIGMLFAPLWKYVFLKGQCYAVTNKRAIIMGRLVTRSWHPRELQFVQRDGVDVHFAKATTTINARHPLVGFDDLSLSDLKAAEAALRQIYIEPKTPKRKRIILCSPQKKHNVSKTSSTSMNNSSGRANPSPAPSPRVPSQP